MADDCIANRDMAAIAGGVLDVTRLESSSRSLPDSLDAPTAHQAVVAAAVAEVVRQIGEPNSAIARALHRSRQMHPAMWSGLIGRR